MSIRFPDNPLDFPCIDSPICVFPRLAGAEEAPQATTGPVPAPIQLRIALDAQDERELRLNIIKHNCQISRNLLMRSQHALLTVIVNNYKGRGMKHEDLVRHATEGLSQAIDSFDLTQGIRFSTCASWWMKQAIKQALVGATHPLPRSA